MNCSQSRLKGSWKILLEIDLSRPMYEKSINLDSNLKLYKWCANIFNNKTMLAPWSLSTLPASPCDNSPKSLFTNQSLLSNFITDLDIAPHHDAVAGKLAMPLIKAVLLYLLKLVAKPLRCCWFRGVKIFQACRIFGSEWEIRYLSKAAIGRLFAQRSDDFLWPETNKYWFQHYKASTDNGHIYFNDDPNDKRIGRPFEVVLVK